MRIQETEIEDCFVVEFTKKVDSRGSFSRLFDFSMALPQSWSIPKFPNVNSSFTSKAGTFRGLHLQLPPFSEKKVIFLGQGAIDDFILDIRSDSPTFGKAVKVHLAAGKNGVLVPEGVAHGFQTLVDNTTIFYLVTQVYSPSHERGISFMSLLERVALTLPISEMSSKDKAWPRLEDVKIGD